MTIYTINAGTGQTTINGFGGAAGIISAAQLSLVDVLDFNGAGLTAANMIMRQVGADVVISFDGVANTSVLLTNISMEALGNDLNNASVGSVFGNFVFEGQANVQTEVDVQKSTDPWIWMPVNGGLAYMNNNSTGASGGAGHDFINGGTGNDQIVGDAGNDVARGGDGNDSIWGDTGNDTIKGDNGDDVILGGDGEQSWNRLGSARRQGPLHNRNLKRVIYSLKISTIIRIKNSSFFS